MARTSLTKDPYHFHRLYIQWQHQKNFVGESRGHKSKNLPTMAEFWSFFPLMGGGGGKYPHASPWCHHCLHLILFGYKISNDLCDKKYFWAGRQAMHWADPQIAKSFMECSVRAACESDGPSLLTTAFMPSLSGWFKGMVDTV